MPPAVRRALESGLPACVNVMIEGLAAPQFARYPARAGRALLRTVARRCSASARRPRPAACAAMRSFAKPRKLLMSREWIRSFG